MQLTSSAIQPGQPIPVRYSCDGKNISPQIAWGDVPRGTKSLAIILHDPDAPKPGGFTHWVVYNIPPETNRIEEHIPQQARIESVGMQGNNDAGRIGYTGPCPPSGTHRYVFRLFALDQMLDLEPGSSPEEVQAALEGHIIERAELMGTYARSSARAAQRAA